MSTAMAMPNLKLNFWWMNSLEQIPNGYRLATVEEITHHFNPRLHHIPPHPLTTPSRILNPGTKAMHLLDGWMTYSDPSYHHLFQHRQTYTTAFLKVVVKDKEWNEDAGIWRTKSSACFSSDGVLLRNRLYHHLPLSNQARQIALLNGFHGSDTEVLYWLLTTISSSEELESFKSSFTEQHFDSCLDSYGRMVGCLLSNNFPFRLPLEPDSDGNTAIDYAIQCAKVPDVGKENHLRVVDLLVELFSCKIVHWENSNGMSFLDMAEEEGLIPIFTKLLSVSEQPLGNHLESIKPRFEVVLLEAVESGYVILVEKLLEFKIEMPIDGFLLVRVLRSIASTRSSHHLLHKLLELYRNEIDVYLAGKDEDEQPLLYLAAESDNPDFLELFKTLFNSLNNVVLSEAEAKSDQRVGHVLIESRDYIRRTLLHIAASKGNKNTVNKLLALFEDKSDEAAKYIKEKDSFGRTALQMACRGGHRDIVKVLLDEQKWGKWDPIKERDANGNTTLHYAAQGSNPKVAESICQLLLESCSDLERPLLLWASAGGIGTADEGESVHPSVKTFLQKQKTSDRTHLLEAAVLQGNVEIAWELLNRGADIDSLRDLIVHDLIVQHLSENYVKNVEHVLSQLELLKERGRDQPSKEDKLGRNVFAEGLAALFLNRFIESPITVGICGEWGMGKSSVMIQTENILLITAAQMTFPNLLKFEDFVGAKKISLSQKGRKIYQTINRGASSLFVQEEILFFKLYHKVKEWVKNFLPSARHRFREQDPLVKILREYQPQYHAIYKSLACMDNYQLIDSPKRTTSSHDHSMRQVPRLLTIQYNAWHYCDQHEAWAGLAVTITKEIENSMTRAQWFSTCWRYSWNKNYINIYFHVFLPCLLATFLAGWIAWAAWILLKQAKFKELKFGSIPITLITIVWIVLKSVMSVVKPVSVQMLGYITSPDHTNRLGYQEQVISDINFLKKELGVKPHWFFSVVSGQWCWDWFGLFSDNVENSSIRKFKPASEDQLRIITFVDDLDRCEEKVILQVLSAVNLVLARCKINVVMGIDKQMIERAIRRSFEDAEDNDLAEKFLCKIIQIPLSLPDPTEDETKTFLEYQLGHKLQHKISKDDHTDYGTPDVDVEDEENSARSDDNREAQIDIDGGNPSQTRCPDIIKKAADWLLRLLRCSYSTACNILSEVRHREDQSNGQETCPLAFSKGARLMREMLISNYSEEEAHTFDKLRKFATGNQKLPREWKRLLNYHKLAWNILYKRGDVHSLPNWKVELVVWIFVCWQWKHEINTLIKDWSKFVGMAGSRGRHGPTLSQIIIKNFVNELENSEKREEPEGNSVAKKSENFLEVRGSLRKEKSVTFYVQGHAGEGPSHNSWNKLIEALKVEDVSMKGIQLFQQFRLHCETDHLPWPVTN